ncbi:MAG: DEAD/DEAH box helicase [Planctomycetota bacterium]|jgi:ATP-dependent RNA helicase DeaD
MTTDFGALGVSPEVLLALEEIGYKRPSSIQAAAIPHLLAGRDLLGTAQTGTGKTAAFALPLLSRVDLENLNPQILVLAPTRELAMQVSDAFRRYAGKMKGFRVLPVYGGQDYFGQQRDLRRGVHAVVGTPGRVMDHLKRGSLVLDQLQCVVLDEADEMLRMGFIDDVEWILQQTPDKHQTALFSATMPGPIRKIAETHLNDPREVRIENKTATVEHTEQWSCLVQSHKKFDTLTRLLETSDIDGMLIFARTKTATVDLAERLESNGFSCAALNGDMNQQTRERTIGHFRNSRFDILVATDVAARGIDVPRISHVVNFDIPFDIESYIHRIGRTGRAGRTGTAITFVTSRECRMLRAIERTTRSPIGQLPVPGVKQLAVRRVEAFKKKMQEVLAGEEDLTFFGKLIREFASENDCSVEDAAASLVFMQQRNRPLQPEPDRTPPPRHPRQERNGHSRRPPRINDAKLERFRIQVGRDHGVTPGHIVGAIANESGLAGHDIGRIQLFNKESTVDLPLGMPKCVLKHLQKVRIFQKPLAIQRVPSDGASGARRR